MMYVLEVSKDNKEWSFLVSSPELDKIKLFVSKFKKEKKAKLYKYLRISKYVFDCYL